MEERIYNLLNMAIPAIIVLFGTIVTNRANSKNIIKNLQEERKRIRLENEILINNRNKDEFLSNQKELFNLIIHIKAGYSRSKNYRMQELNLSWKKFDIHSAKLIELSLKAQLLVNMYFPNLKEKMDRIYSLMDVAWGQQKSLFLKCDVNKEQALDEFVQYSLIIEGECKSMLEDIVDLSFKEYKSM